MGGTDEKGAGTDAARDDPARAALPVDRGLSREAFLSYAGRYDASDRKIALKVAHTLRVAGLCDRIARSLDATGRRGGRRDGRGRATAGTDPELDAGCRLSDAGPDPELDAGRNCGLSDAGRGLSDAGRELSSPDPDLAWLAGILHDVGRFEQVRHFGTFNDAASVRHADVSVEVLFDRGGLADYLPAQARDLLDRGDPGALRAVRMLRRAVALHSDYRLPEDLDPRERGLAVVLRDADKVDILHANCLERASDILGVPEEQIRASRLSDGVERAFYEHRTVRREERSTPADVVAGFACFVFEMHTAEARRAAREQGDVFKLLARPFDDPDTRARFDAMGDHLRRWLDRARAGG